MPFIRGQTSEPYVVLYKFTRVQSEYRINTGNLTGTNIFATKIYDDTDFNLTALPAVCVVSDLHTLPHNTYHQREH